MHIWKLFVLCLAVFALAGCSSSTIEKVKVHSEAYYVKHPKALKRANAWCNLKHLSRSQATDCENAQAAAIDKNSPHLPHFSW
ncbi:EexN family lipoprotein [Acidithiobacillus thiooxidans]|uniref:Lipoprotein n=3 Tax=Acidithiobacillus TaxID=119977 RepID=A0A1C2IVK7_ACITH|nr:MULTISPECIES: EexN family lipoprotein [Acidithiobacillus]MBU2742266.1 EexN family lipoprotein [Acidithiobacillus albertensis]MBU2761096.1 EexN family lipoprotein [Acidithiobacillus sulfurivorans]MBU2837020.1 EexN family lipoprotein [Acidithiobacillus thiooxidans]OCX68125.1 hypothetical protein A6M23_18950 [Acidithiobacillus thiooxidans]OCX80033.1 hypothetical protein A6P08_17110 [Acidithiobacillus thiooxidans]